MVLATGSYPFVPPIPGVDKKGVFVSERNFKSLLETINFIIKNYSAIQKDMISNQLPTKKEFFSKMTDILNTN